MKKGPPPNIVLILSDDQAWTDYGFMGHDRVQTPNLDRLADESVVFKRGYVPTALCRPSLMTLATGHYAHRHGVTGNSPSRKHAVPDSPLYNERRAALISYIQRFDTLPELLVEKGYLCHQSGKWWEGAYANGGFTHGMTRGFPNPGCRIGDDGLKIGREGMKPIEDFVDLAIEQEKPFFLWYAPYMPHVPHTPPARLLNKYTSAGLKLPVARYYAMCEWFDETCGQLVELLEKRNARENTLIVYVTDNGWVQNPRGGGHLTRSKASPYEAGVRTPIMFSWPGVIDPADRDEVVSSIDLMPTMLAAAGARIPEGLPGINLWPHLTKGTPVEREMILGENFAHNIADINDPEASLTFRWCIADKWKLLLTYDGEVVRTDKAWDSRTVTGPQLFDLLTDPHETNNVAASHPEVVARLAKAIAEWYPVTKRKTKELAATENQPSALVQKALDAMDGSEEIVFVALDEQGLAVKRMQSYTMIMPGETQGCVGCHDNRAETFLPPHTLMAMDRGPSQLEPIRDIPEIIEYRRHIQPLWDKHCVRCHNAEQPDGRVIMTGDYNEWACQSYFSLFAAEQISDA